MPAESEIDEIMIALYYTGDDLVQASETLKSHDMPAFGVVENLVEEEVGVAFKYCESGIEVKCVCGLY